MRVTASDSFLPEQEVTWVPPLKFNKKTRAIASLFAMIWGWGTLISAYALVEVGYLQYSAVVVFLYALAVLFFGISLGIALTVSQPAPARGIFA